MKLPDSNSILCVYCYFNNFLRIPRITKFEIYIYIYLFDFFFVKVDLQIVDDLSRDSKNIVTRRILKL